MIILLQIYKTFPIFIEIDKEMWLFYIKNRCNHQQIALYHLQAIQVYFTIFLYSFVNSTTFSIICINCIMYFSNLHTSAIALCSEKFYQVFFDERSEQSSSHSYQTQKPR